MLDLMLVAPMLEAVLHVEDVGGGVEILPHSNAVLAGTSPPGLGELATFLYGFWTIQARDRSALPTNHESLPSTVG
jgi:hypothetical protein